jgi:hypothetical protein
MPSLHILSLLKDKLSKMDLPAIEKDFNKYDEDLVNKLINSVKDHDNQNVLFEDEEDLFDCLDKLDPDQDPDYFDDTGRCNVPELVNKKTNDKFTFVFIAKILNLKDKGLKFETINKLYPSVKHPTYISRFREYYDNNGTHQEKYARVGKEVLERWVYF